MEAEALVKAKFGSQTIETSNLRRRLGETRLDSAMRKLLAVSFILFLTIFRVTAAANEYKLIKEIPSSGEGGWDYLSIDPKARHLYVTHANKVVVVDLNSDSIAGEIADTPGVHGFAVAPELGRGFSSNGRENKVSIVDLKTLKTLSKVETGQNPDAILFEPRSGEVYAFNGRGQSATVFEAASGKVVTTIPLGGKPEFAQADLDAGRI